MCTKRFDVIKPYKVHHFAGLVNKSALSPVIRFMIRLTLCNETFNKRLKTQIQHKKESNTKKIQHKRKE